MFNRIESWKNILTVKSQVLEEVNVRRGIFLEDTLSPIVSVIALIPLSIILWEIECGYQREKHSIKINHLLFMNSIKLYTKNERELNSLIYTMHIFSQDVSMKFGTDKYKLLTMQRGRIKYSDGLKLLYGELIKEIDTGGYKYFGKLQGDQIRQREMK